MGPGGPDLLARNDPAVAVGLGPALQAGQVRSGFGFREELAPDLGAPQQRREVAAALRTGAVGQHGGGAHPQADYEDVQGAGRRRRRLLVEDDLMPVGEVLPAVGPGPRDGGQAGVEEQREATAGPGHPHLVGGVVYRRPAVLIAHPALEGPVMGQERAHMLAKVVVGDFLGPIADGRSCQESR